jgi:hypothetical protein
VKNYIVDIVLATRDPKPYGIDLNGWVQYGASPRGTISLTLAARAMHSCKVAATSRRRM